MSPPLLWGPACVSRMKRPSFVCLAQCPEPSSHASRAAVDTSRPGSLVIRFTCVSPLPLRGLTQVTWVLSSEALGMEWRCPLPEWEAVLTLSLWLQASAGAGEGQEGDKERHRGAQTKTKGYLSLAQQLSDSRAKCIPGQEAVEESVCGGGSAFQVRTRRVVRKHGFQAWS